MLRFVRRRVRKFRGKKEIDFVENIARFSNSNSIPPYVCFPSLRHDADAGRPLPIIDFPRFHSAMQ